MADAITTFGKIEAVNVDSNISNNNDPVEKALKAIPTNAGLMSSLFIPQSSADLKIAIQKDSAYVIKLVERYNNWLLYQARFIEKSLTLKFLPITWENHTDYFNRVRAKFDFGLNKILFAMSDGLKQSEVLAQIFIEEAYDLANLITPQQNANTLTNVPDQDAKKSQSDTHDTNSQAVEGEEEKVEPAE